MTSPDPEPTAESVKRLLTRVAWSVAAAGLVALVVAGIVFRTMAPRDPLLSEEALRRNTANAGETWHGVNITPARDGATSITATHGNAGDPSRFELSAMRFKTVDEATKENYRTRSRLSSSREYEGPQLPTKNAGLKCVKHHRGTVVSLVGTHMNVAISVTGTGQLDCDQAYDAVVDFLEGRK